MACVERWGVSKHTTVESFEEFRDKILQVAKEKNREGTVVKWVNPSPKGDKFLFFKEKLDIPSKPKLTQFDKGSIELNALPESEVRGELTKMVADHGLEKLHDVKFAMPLLAQNVARACKENLRSPPKNLFVTYTKFMREQEQ